MRTDLPVPTTVTVHGQPCEGQYMVFDEVVLVEYDGRSSYRRIGRLGPAHAARTLLTEMATPRRWMPVVRPATPRPHLRGLARALRG